MSYTINRSLECNNIIMFKTDIGTEYAIKLKKTSSVSTTWTLDFSLINGIPDGSEVFKTMNTLYTILIEQTEKNNITNIIVTISGKNKDEIDQKTKIFTRWIISPWEYKIEHSPAIKIKGKRQKIYLNTNIINMYKK